MARKSTARSESSATKTRSPKKRKSTKTKDLQELIGDRDYKEIFKELAANPAVRYVAGGIATAVLTRLANNMSQRYPEISSFIKENLENLDDRFGNLGSEISGEESARH